MSYCEKCKPMHDGIVRDMQKWIDHHYDNTVKLETRNKELVAGHARITKQYDDALDKVDSLKNCIAELLDALTWNDSMDSEREKLREKYGKLK